MSNRVNVYNYPGPDGDPFVDPAELVGWFDYDKAERWTDADHNGNGSRGTGRGTALYRTAQGRWVLENWSSWQDEGVRHEYITDKQAQDWLLRSYEEEAAAKHFGPVEEERGPGRPKVGEQVCFTVAPAHLAFVDAAAAQQGVARSVILRAAVASYVERSS